MANLYTTFLPAEYILRLTTDEFSSGYYYVLNSASNATEFTSISAGQTIDIGSYSVPRQYGVVSTSGNIQIEKIPAGAFGSYAEGLGAGNVQVKATWFNPVGSGTTGTLTTVPEGGTVLFDDFASGVDVVVSGVTNGLPDYTVVTTGAGTPVTATLSADLEYTLSGTPSSYPVAIIFTYRTKFHLLDYTKYLTAFDIDDGGTGGGAVDSVNALEGDVTVQGTANQVTVSDDGVDTITLATPQDIATTSDVTFGSLDVTNNITVSGTVDGVDIASLKTDVDGFPDALKNLTTGEINQLENISTVTISTTQWAWLGAQDQNLSSSQSVQFNGLTVSSYSNNSFVLNSSGGVTYTSPKITFDGFEVNLLTDVLIGDRAVLTFSDAFSENNVFSSDDTFTSSAPLTFAGLSGAKGTLCTMNFDTVDFKGDITISGTVDGVDVSTIGSDISTNAANIATNTADIATNTSDIATNASDIATNTSDIATNASDIATNASNISSLTTDVNGFPDRLKNLTTAEIQQLENINSSTVSTTQWGYVGALNQGLTTTSSVDFNSVTITNSSTSAAPSQLLLETTADGGAGVQFKNTDTSTNLWQIFVPNNGEGLTIGRDSVANYQQFDALGNCTFSDNVTTDGIIYGNDHLLLTGRKGISIGGDGSTDNFTTPTAQLVLGGAHNVAYNLGTKLLISGMDNETNAIAINCKDENSNEIFKVRTNSSGSGADSIVETPGRVGAGTSFPLAKIHAVSSGSVLGSTTWTAIIQDSGTSTTSSRMLMAAGSLGYSQIDFGDGDDVTSGFVSYYHADDTLLFGVKGTGTAVQIRANGAIHALEGSRGFPYMIGQWQGINISTSWVYLTLPTETSSNRCSRTAVPVDTVINRVMLSVDVSTNTGTWDVQIWKNESLFQTINFSGPSDFNDSAAFGDKIGNKTISAAFQAGDRIGLRARDQGGSSHECVVILYGVTNE